MHRYGECRYEGPKRLPQVSLENNPFILQRHHYDETRYTINVTLKTVLNRATKSSCSRHFSWNTTTTSTTTKTRICETDRDFLPDLEAFERALNGKTKAVILNSPNNPTGVVYHEDFLRRLGEILIAKERELGINVYLISDEAYSSLMYDGLKYAPIFNLYHRSLIATSHSKDLALPGERIGYIAVHPSMENKADLINGMIFCNRILGYVNAPALMQNVVRHLQHITVSIPEYQEKRDYMYNNLIDMGYQLVKPQGAFYMFPRSPLENDVDFVHELQKQNVLTVPGRGFGGPAISGYHTLRTKLSRELSPASRGLPSSLNSLSPGGPLLPVIANEVKQSYD
jgi:aspartate aminotransferase